MSSSRAVIAVTVVAALSVLLAGCGPGTRTTAPSSSSGPPNESPSEGPSQPPVAVSVGLGFVASVQFAPFYLADQAGYYEEAGLEVTFRHGFDYDVVALVAQGDLDLGLADGTSVIPAVSNGFPIKYVATIYGRFPSIVFAKASTGIATPADLAGRKVGIPGRFGSSWIMLQALLESANLTPDDIELSEIGFTQGEAVAQGLVEAATGFTNNEPVQLRLTGEAVNVLRVDEITPLPGNGLIVGPKALDEKSDAIAAFIAATLRAMEEIAAKPEVGLEAAIQAVPDLAAARDAQAAILDATIEVWRGPVQAARGLGAIEPADWAASITYLESLDLVPNKVTVEDLLETGLLPGGG